MNYQVRYCHVCGQRIERMYWDEYIYTAQVTVDKRRKAHETVYFCGWNCMRKYEKERDAKRHGKGRHNSDNIEA